MYIPVYNYRSELRNLLRVEWSPARSESRCCCPPKGRTGPRGLSGR